MLDTFDLRCQVMRLLEPFMRLQRNQMAELWMLAYSSAVVEDLDGLENPVMPLDSSSDPAILDGVPSSGVTGILWMPLVLGRPSRGSQSR